MVFETEVERHKKAIIQIIKKYTNDQWEIEDIYQEVVLRAWWFYNNFKFNSSFYTWIYRIAVNTCINYTKSMNRRPPCSDLEVTEEEEFGVPECLIETGTPEALAEKEEAEEAILESLDELPEEIRLTETLYDFDGFSYEEISEALDCPLGTVRSRISRARNHVYNSLERV